jgi:hypothetical protein
MSPLTRKSTESIEGRKMKKKAHIKLLIFNSFFALPGCQGVQNNSEVGMSTKLGIEKDAPTLVVGEVAKPQVAVVKSQVNKATKDLASKLNVLSDEIKVISTENVTWRDGSLGCPQKGMMYTQALVPGALIVLGSGDVEYEYHSGGGRDPFYCTKPQAPAPATSVD